MLGALFAILGFLISPWGIMCILLGLVSFIGMPIVSTATQFKGPANFFLKMATFPIKRAAIVISEHNDALMKQMKFSGLGVEMITIDDEEKAFEDPDNALHHFLGIPFAFADEEHGVLFDPRHAAAGMRKRMKNKLNESSYLATEKEWEEWGVSKWMPGVFEMPKKYELVDLSAVQELIDGGERSEFAKRVEELYKHSRDPFDDGTPAMKYLYPIIAIAVTFGGVWFMVSQFGIPSVGGGGADSTVGYGQNLLWLAALAPALKQVNWRRVVPVLLGVLIPVGLVGALVVLFNVVLAVAVVVCFLLGFLLMPLFTVIGQPSKLIAGGLSKLYFKLGFFGFRQPVLTWTQSKYVLKEYDQLETTDNIVWYDLFGHTVGVSYEPGEASWDGEPISTDTLEGHRINEENEVTDTELPSKYDRSEDLGRDGYGAYLPTRLQKDKYYVHSAMVLERFKNSANGEKSLKKLLEAKEMHGSGSDGIDDEVVFKTTLVSGIVGLLAGISIFIVPAFL